MLAPGLKNWGSLGPGFWHPLLKAWQDPGADSWGTRPSGFGVWPGPCPGCVRAREGQRLAPAWLDLGTTVWLGSAGWLQAEALDWDSLAGGSCAPEGTHFRQPRAALICLSIHIFSVLCTAAPGGELRWDLCPHTLPSGPPHMTRTESDLLWPCALPSPSEACVLPPSGCSPPGFLCV